MMDMYQFDWNNQKVLSRNRKAPRVHFYPYGTTELAKKGEQADRVEVLNGSWNFDWFDSPLKVPEALLAKAYDAEANSITVPLNWQYAGYGKYCYTDLLYPFPVDPPHVTMENETGVYRRSFQVELQDGEQLAIRFEGAESAYHVYVNGKEAGYSQGSRMPSEFDITELVQNGENLLTVVVYQYSDGTYLEDQDMWWLGGITRDVLLLHRPACHLADMVLDPDYDRETGEGILHPTLPLSCESGRVELEVYDAAGTKLETKEAEDGIRVLAVKPWTAETPVLYTVVAVVYDENNAVTEAVPQRIGFRHVEIKKGVLTVNGAPIFMRGVNRHEYNPKTGRAITKEQTVRELGLIKEHGLNAIRCSHYPNNPFFYDVCEEIGLYVIDECDLETHGFEPLGQENQLNSDPEWKDAYLDRVQRMVGRDRNRACVILWSLGNESAYGPNFKAMYDWCKENEPTRPVHYEGDFKNQAVDVSSTMYSTIGRLKELDTQLEPKRPHIHCEFGHAMGNGPGSLKEYFEVSENSERIQGVFVWEFKDHGVYELREDGKECYRFGGEYGEKFHNGNFCMDGLVRSDGTPTPGFWEYVRVAQPLFVREFDLEKGTFTLKNRFDFLSVSEFECQARVLCDGEEVKNFVIALPEAGPRSVTEVSLPTDMLDGCDSDKLVTLELTFVSRNPVYSQEAGWVGGKAGVVLQEEKPAERKAAGAAACQLENGALLVSGNEFSFRLDLATARIKDYRAGGVLLLEDGPALNYNRVYTDNDIKNKPMWEERHLHSMCMSVKNVNWENIGDELVITVEGKFSPQGLDWGTNVTVVYTVSADGAVKVAYTGDFYGKAPTELPKIGTCSHVPTEFHQVVWRGYGPGECYCDSREAQTDGIWKQEAAEMGFDYSCPQEYANRTGVHWTVMQNEAGVGFAVAASRPIDMAVRKLSDDALDKTTHSCDLQADEKRFYLHLDYRNSGLGSGSCGPIALDQYKAFPIHYEWQMAFVPFVKEESAVQAARRAGGCL